MRIKLVISDDDYRRILATPKRVRGTICQNSPEEFCFRAYSESNESEQLPKRQFKTKHSTTTVNSKRIRLYMSIPRETTTVNSKRIRLYMSIPREETTDPAEIIYDEVDDAASFVEQNME